MVLQPNLKGYESFTVEIGWSKLGRFPELGMRPSMQPPSADHAEFAQPEYVCRLGKDLLGADYWWEVEPFERGLTPEQCLAILQKRLDPIPADQAASRVKPHVVDAIRCLETLGLPYLQGFVAHGAD